METPYQIAKSSFESLGFSDNEARLYLVLLEAGPQTAYELAKRSGVPRANVYSVLERLEKRGAVVKAIEDETPHYSALPPDEMLNRISNDLQGEIREARDALAAIKAPPPDILAWNQRGYKAVMQRAEEMIRTSSKQLLIGLWSNESMSLSNVLSEAHSRAVQVSTLCIQGCARQCDGCRGEVYRYPVSFNAPTRWLVVVADERDMLMAQIQPDGSALGIHSSADVLVALAGQYLRNTIGLSEIVRSLGPRLLDVLDEPARAALRSTGLDLQGKPWLDQLIQAVRSASTLHK
jgi:HTH-type transcriptional regulator, sugar sensing transcriptional regulator